MDEFVPPRLGAEVSNFAKQWARCKKDFKVATGKKKVSYDTTWLGQRKGTGIHDGLKKLDAVCNKPRAYTLAHEKFVRDAQKYLRQVKISALPNAEKKPTTILLQRLRAIMDESENHLVDLQTRRAQEFMTSLHASMVSLDQMLADKTVSGMLKQHFKREHTTETLNFYMAYRAGKSPSKLYRRFIREGAKEEINVNNVLRAGAANGDVTPVFNEVVSLMQTNTLMRFKNSQALKDYIQEETFGIHDRL